MFRAVFMHFTITACACGVERRQENRDQQRDDADHHQKLNQREMRADAAWSTPKKGARREL